MKKIWQKTSTPALSACHLQFLDKIFSGIFFFILIYSCCFLDDEQHTGLSTSGNVMVHCSESFRIREGGGVEEVLCKPAVWCVAT